jgi:hypothetical protein
VRAQVSRRSAEGNAGDVDAILVVFLSAGRCGTQWLAANLADCYPGELEVEHEPLGPLYRPRRFFRRYADPGAILVVPEVRRHLERVARTPRYVETGWPVFCALPLLARRFADRLRVVHLTRHPVPSALSHLAHNSYASSPRDDAYTRLATLGPSDPGVFQPHYAEGWDELGAFEKCLFWWTEVNLFGLEFEERFAAVPFLRLKSEDLLGGERRAFERLVGFMQLRWDERLLERTGRRIDRWYHHTDRDLDPLAIRDHPKAIETAARLGYDAADFDLAALKARYRGEPDPGLDRIGRFA